MEAVSVARTLLSACLHPKRRKCGADIPARVLAAPELYAGVDKNVRA